MPNWCFDRMIVMGPKRSVSAFLKAITVPEKELNEQTVPTPDTPREKYDINRLVPLDPRASVTKTYKNIGADGKEREITMSHFADKASDGFDGYSHAIERWGSKWGACRVEVTDPRANPLDITFESAWSPPTRLISAVSALFPDLLFGIYFDEESQAFIGYEIYSNGEIVEKYSDEPDPLSDPEISALYDAYQDDDANPTAENDYYDALNDYNNDLLDKARDEMEEIMRQYVQWQKRQSRRAKQGLSQQPFTPE